MATLDQAILSVENFMNVETPPRQMFLSPWLPEGSITLISGWRGIGKTWFLLSLIDAINKGQPFGPWQTEIPTSCLYMEGELHEADFRDRLRGLENGVERKAPLHIYSNDYAGSQNAPPMCLRGETSRDDVKAWLIYNEIKILAFDCVGALSPGIDENSKKDWDEINQWLISLRFSGIASILLHHTGKKGDQRGTSAREDNVDTSIILAKPHDYDSDQGARFVVKFEKNRCRLDSLHLISNNEFSMIETDGHIQWTHKSVKGESRIEILKMLNEGIRQSDISRSLSVSTGYVSQVKTQAIQAGHLTQKGKLIDTGFWVVNPLESPKGLNFVTKH